MCRVQSIHCVDICITSPSVTSVKPSKAYSRGSVVMVDEIINASPSKYRFPEAGLRVMVTSHFGPKTRLRMASRLIITEVQPKVVDMLYLLSHFLHTEKKTMAARRLACSLT